MIEGIFSSESKPEKDSVQEIATSFHLSATCSSLKPKWLAKIASNRQHISHLMHKLLEEESLDSSGNDPSNEMTPPFPILERLQIQQKNLIHIVSDLILVNTSLSTAIKEEESSSEVNHNKSELLQWLKERGYVSLANKLALQSGYPWDEIEKIQSPILIEQLVDLYLLCCHQESTVNMPKNNTKKLIDFALHLASLTTPSNLNSQFLRSYELVDDAKQVLGQLIYLINQDPNLAIQAIDTLHYKEALDNIKDQFVLQIQNICYSLQTTYIAHHETQLQNPDIAINVRIPVEIGKALLTKIGTINVGIIDTFSDIFLSSDKQYINYEANLSYALRILQRSPKLRNEFEKIHQPQSLKIGSYDVIRASLGLLPNHSINYLDTKLTALIALLSHLRQGEDRSCFAVSLAIEILSAHLGFCFKDLKQLLEEGKLKRHIKGIVKDIPFVKRINDENLYKKISFNEKGSLFIEGEKKGFLWQAPGIQAVCQSVGILNPQETLLKIIQELPPQEENNYVIEIRILIQKICQQVDQNNFLTSPNFESLYNQACFAFSSQTSQPLLKVWENAIANMAEAEEGGMIKTAILETTLDALQFKLGELKIPPSSFLQYFFLYIQKHLHEKIHLRYDPAVLSYLDGESLAKAGGFILYDDKKQKIDNEQAFRQFILTILLEVNDKILNSSSLTEEEKDSLNEVIPILTSYLHSNEFIGYVLARYHPSNKLAVSQFFHGQSIPYKELQFTPWITQTGNNSKALLNIYLETEKPIPTEHFSPSGAEEALTNIIEMCKRMSTDEKRQFMDNPNKLKPLCIVGKHRLPFMAGNPSLVRAWQQEYPTKEWIDHFVLTPGKKVADTIIDSKTRQHFIHHLKNDILSTLISTNKVKACLQLCQQIPEGVTIKEYRSQVVKICQNISIQSSLLSEKITRRIDTTLCNSLEPSLKKILEDSAVHFADTNWCKGIQDIHFCFAVNPGTGKLELWEAYANGSHLVALDQSYWLFNQKWEFLTLQEDLIPDDDSYLLGS